MLAQHILVIRDSRAADRILGRGTPVRGWLALRGSHLAGYLAWCGFDNQWEVEMEVASYLLRAGLSQCPKDSDFQS